MKEHKLYQKRMVEYTAHKIRYQDSMHKFIKQNAELSKLSEGYDGR